MFLLLQAIFRLVLVLVPFMETIFLSYSFSYFLGSPSFGVILFIILMICTAFKWVSGKSIAWGFLSFIFFYDKMESGFLTAFLYAMVLGGFRYVISMGVKRVLGK